MSPNLKELCGFTLDTAISKYGTELGQEKWRSYCEQQAITNSFEYKARTHNWSKEEFDSYNSARATTLENLIRRHGEITGAQKWQEYCTRQQYTNSIEYFIEKFGTEAGPDKWLEYCTARGNSNNIEFLKQRYQLSHSEAEELLASRRATASNSKYVSNGERKFVNQITQVLPDINYTCLSKQFCIWHPTIGVPMFYDVASTARKKIIEYNGDYWHANPAKYSEEFVVKQSNLTAPEIWQRDLAKKQLAETRGFQVYTVWESEYLATPEVIIDKLTKWWNNGFQTNI